VSSHHPGAFITAVVTGGTCLVLRLATSLPLHFIIPIGLIAGAAMTALITIYFPGHVTRPDLIPEPEIVTRTYRARRAFELEGRHYFIELEDRSVMFLSGGYLWNAHMPNSEFVLSWRRLTGFRAGIECVGKPLEPELVVPALTEEEMRSLPVDGAILTGRTYDAVKEEFTQRRGAA